MNNVFKRTGFDSLIGAGLHVESNIFSLPPGSTMVIDGSVNSKHINTAIQDASEKPNLKTTLVVNGNVNLDDTLSVRNITITGSVTANLIICEGVLAIKAGARVAAKEIRYRSIIIEDGAVVLANMQHLDHVSIGEQV